MENTKTKKINWLFPDPDTEVTEKDFEKKIHEDERSGDMSLEDFISRFAAWKAENV